MLQHLMVEEKLAFLSAAQSTPVRASAAAQVGTVGASPDNRQHELLALQAKSAATKHKERLVISKKYLSQQDGHHTVLPSDATAWPCSLNG